MQQALHMVMVPAADIERLTAFYSDALGWQTWGPVSPMSVMYKLGSAVLVFLNKDYLSAESGIDVASSPRSIWAIFVDNKEEVDRQMEQALAAGATLTSAIRDRDGGLYSGYFTDPEGNGWELVWSPHMAADANGALGFRGQ